jgi:hypothetical protein
MYRTRLICRLPPPREPVVAAVASVYLRSQHPGTLTQFADGHRTSLKSAGNWKSAMIVVTAVAVGGVITAVAGTVKVVKT